MSITRAHLRQTGRIGITSAALSLALATGFAGAASAGGTGSSTSPQPISHADANHGGANGQCPGGAYCSTRDGSPSLNGNGTGKATGKPCAGCVGKADNKNPKGQSPNGSDHNAGYECDRNHGVGRSNPAHTGCKHEETETPCPTPTPEVTPEKSTTPTPAVSPTTATAAAPIVVSPAEAIAAAPAVATVNPLPLAAAAGQADTSGELAAGGLAGLVALLALRAGFVLRRRQSRVS